MIFGRGRRYKLPKFPDNIESVFKSLCEAVSEEDIPQIRQELEECVEKLHSSSEDNELIDLKMVDQIKHCCDHLLDRYSEYSASQRSLAIGAIRYFVITDDPFPDQGFSSGYFDDAMVMNYVLEELGEEDLFIDAQ